MNRILLNFWDNYKKKDCKQFHIMESSLDNSWRLKKEVAGKFKNK